jgi:hypothetical protein
MFEGKTPSKTAAIRPMMAQVKLPSVSLKA